MNRIFEHHKSPFKTPMIERTTIEGENIFSEVIDPRTNKAFTSWSCTLSSMGHKSEKALVDRLKELHYEEIAAAESV